MSYWRDLFGRATDRLKRNAKDLLIVGIAILLVVTQGSLIFWVCQFAPRSSKSDAFLFQFFIPLICTAFLLLAEFFLVVDYDDWKKSQRRH